MLHPVRLCLGAVLLVSAASRTAADYPIVAHRHLADPAALVHDGRVYVYASNDDDNPVEGGYEMKSLVCVSSRDLKNWTDHGEVIRVPRDAGWAVHTWAPAVIERNGTFFLYFSNNASGIGVATSDRPTGPFQDALGRPLIDASTPGVLPAQNLWIFDPAVFIDRDGQAYLYFGGNGESNLRIIRLNPDMISVSGAAQPVTVPHFFEAAWMHEREGRYYLSYSTVPAAGMRIDYLTAAGPLGPFTHAGTVAAQPPLNENNNHAAIFELNGAWYHVYHNRAVARQAGIPPVYRRNLAIEQLHYEADGRIRPVEYTVDGMPQAAPLHPYEQVEAETFAAQSGVETAPGGDGIVVTDLAEGDWIRVRGVGFGPGGAAGFSARVAAAGAGGELILRLDAADGPVAATCAVAPTGGTERWVTVRADVSGASGTRDLYLTFRGAGASLFNLDWWHFEPAAAPSLATQPRSLTVAPGGRAMFWVQPESTDGLTYEWTRDGATIAGATEAMLSLPTVTAADAGEYRVIVHHAAGSTTSAAARLTVRPGARSELSNLSVRAALDEGEVLISGFVAGSVE